MLNKPAQTTVPLHPLLQNRWSPRAFNADKPVREEDLVAIMEAARWAPSCFNDQPWRFIVCHKSTQPAAWDKALSAIVPKNQLWAQQAPVLILAAAMANFGHNGQPNRWAAYDTGAACMSLTVQAAALGLCVHQMGGFDALKATALFNLPTDCQPIAMLALGYQAPTTSLAGEFQAAEQAERVRADLSSRFFKGDWGAA